MNNEISGKTLLSVTASIAATIIPDTPIVSIAGATLSEITTTTTSTTTTPTPTPTPTSFIQSNKTNKDHNNANLPNNPMSDAAVAKSAGGNGIAVANNTTSNTPADTGGIVGKNSLVEHTTIVNIANAGKTDDTTTNTDTKKSDVSDLEEPELKKLLDEAYNYKTPKDKKDKSEIFLDLLQKVENEDLGITSTRSDSHRHHPHSQSRHQQKQGGSLQDLLQLPSDYRRQNHTSRHKKNSSVSSRQREGGSLPSNVNVANCLLSSFGQQSSVYTDKRVRRGILPGVESASVALNSNKTLVGVVGLAVGDSNANCLLSSFEQQTPVYAEKPVRRIIGLAGGNPNATTGGTGSSGSGGANSVGVCSKDSGNSVGASVTSVSGGTGNLATTASGHSVGGTMATGAGIVNSAIKSGNSISGSSDYIINIGDMIDIQQQQQILPSKSQDSGQGLPYYERVDIDMRIPRPNLHRGEGGDFAPAHSHHYVDEVIRFHQIDGGDGSLCESGEVAISVNNLGNKLKSAAASCSLPMPLDERYRSIKSVMGEKGDIAGASLNAAISAKASGTITANSGGSINNPNNTAGGAVGTNSIGLGSYTKSLPLSRQTDENGNDCERQQHNSSSSITVSAGQSQAKAKAKKKPQKDNTIPVDVENEAGYRGKDPVEVLLKFIEEDSKQSGGGNKFAENNKKKERKKEKVKQSKMKKSNSLEELRSCAKIDVGELKQSAATTESNNVTMRSKGSGGGKGGKNNSASTADINKNFESVNKEGATTSPTTGGKQAPVVATNANTTANNRKGERRSWGTEELQYLGTEGSVGGTGSNSGSVASSGEDKTKEKKDKKSKEKEKEKDKDKERDLEKDRGKDKEKEKEKDKDKDSDRHDKLTNNKIDGNTKLEKHDRNDKVEKAEKQQEKIEKPERADKLEKRKKSESIMHTPNANSVERQDGGTPVFSAIDLLSMNTLISETAEFHVVTKKKKPKKQRASIDETHFTQSSNYNNSNNSSGHNSYNNNNSGTTGGFSRAHNMVLNAQKSNNSNNNVSQQQQQQQSRYKYHNNNAHNNSYGNGGGSGTNNNNFGEDGRIDYRNNYNANYNNNYNNHSHQQFGYQQQQQQGPYHHSQHHQQQQQQHHHHPANAHNVNSGSTDKSRRKSTSSVPPSEKSDSSDLDSVHSLPIESTTASATKNKQRHKQNDAAATTTPETPKSAAGGGSPAPISYAHIAAAAAADRWPSLDAANNNNAMANGINASPAIANNTSEQLQTQVVSNAEVATPASISNANTNAAAAAAIVAAAANSASKQNKSKKLTIKPDFPELGSSSTTIVAAPDNSKPNTVPTVIPAVAAAAKTISYSQSLVATPAQLITASNNVGVASAEKVAGPTVEAAVLPTVATAPVAADSNTVTGVNKVDSISGGSARLSQHQPMPHQQPQQPTQPLQKSKSVEHDSYSFNSSNLDQQYPALEKTVKRHSATNVSISPPSGAAALVGGAVASSVVPTPTASSIPSTNAANATKFNFAAAAKQIVVKSCPAPQSILTQEPALAATATQPSTAAATTTSGTSAAHPAAPTNSAITGAANITAAPVAMPVRKPKEKSPTTVFPPATAINTPVAVAIAPITTANSAAQTPELSAAVITARKSKKEKPQSVLTADPAIGLTTTAEPHAHVAQKSSTATQTQATSMDIVTSGKTSRSQSSFDAGSETVVMPPIVSKPQRQHAGSTNNNSKNLVAPVATMAANIGNAAGGAVVGALNCNASSNRPAVIILNDDRAGDSSAVGIEFTFGDFNEDELKFFDDNLAEDECTDELPADESALQLPMQPATAPTASTGVANNSAYHKAAVVPVEFPKDNIVPPFVENTVLFAAVRAASPKPTFMGPPLSNVPVKDIGHIVKTPSSAVGHVVNNNVDEVNANDSSGNVAVAGADADLQLQLQLQQQRRNSESQKLQQLETCNDIETAIIAAARAAAEQQHQQPMQPPPQPPPQQQRSYRHKHQQQYRSTSYGHAYEPPQQREQRSQSAYTRDTPNNYQQQQHHYHSQYHQPQHYHYHQSSSSNSASRSRSSSSNNNANSYEASGSTPPPQSPNAAASVVVNIQRKELDIHFIPPTVSNAYNALQHNEIIVDFIGSAWEEVAKVTKFYEGQ